MKTFSTFLKLVVALFALTATLQSCTEDAEDAASAPNVTTVGVTDITFGSATLGGTIVSTGGADIIAKGICYGTQPEPTVADDTTNQGSGAEAFTTTLQDLTPNNIYYARAYATNSAGTSYGEEYSFGTEAGVPTVTFSISATYYKRAISQWTITSQGASPIIYSGFCYSTTNAYPTTQDNFWPNGSSATEVQKVIEGLEPNTHYYIRGFANNAQGSGYSDVIEVTTLAIPSATDVDGNSYEVAVIGDQAWMAEDLQVTKYNNGDAIPTTTTTTVGEVNPKYQWAYDNNESNVATYGRLYTYYALTDDRKVCPSGWHLPTLDEMNVLIANATILGNPGAVLKEAGTSAWDTNTGANNLTGFSATGGGWRAPDGTYLKLRVYGFYHTATEYNTVDNRYIAFSYNSSTVYPNDHGGKDLGLSVRCLKD